MKLDTLQIIIFLEIALKVASELGHWTPWQQSQSVGLLHVAGIIGGLAAWWLHRRQLKQLRAG